MTDIECALQRATCHASLLVRSRCFPREDWGDLRQELLLDYLRRARKYDPKRGGLEPFARCVIRNQARVLATRGPRLGIGTGDSAQSRDAGAKGEASVRSIDPTDLLHLRIDVERILARVPAQTRAVARLLGELTVVEVCKRTGKSRSRFYQIRRDLRAAFAAAGVGPRPRRRQH